MKVLNRFLADCRANYLATALIISLQMMDYLATRANYLLLSYSFHHSNSSTERIVSLVTKKNQCPSHITMGCLPPYVADSDHFCFVKNVHCIDLRLLRKFCGHLLAPSRPNNSKDCGIFPQTAAEACYERFVLLPYMVDSSHFCFVLCLLA